MKVRLKFNKNTKSEKYHELFIKFLYYLQGKLPLKKDIDVVFSKDKIGNMTTGSRHSNGVIYVLASNRLNRDILRTVAHEWIHEYQMNVMGRVKGPDIGGVNEDEANAFAGRIIKMFERDFPEFESIEYE
jgi:hypothetical protein